MSKNLSPPWKSLSPSPSFSAWSPVYGSKSPPKPEKTPTSAQQIVASKKNNTDLEKQKDQGVSKAKSNGTNAYRRRVTSFFNSIFSTKRGNPKAHDKCFPTILGRNKNVVQLASDSDSGSVTDKSMSNLHVEDELEKSRTDITCSPLHNVEDSILDMHVIRYAHRKDDETLKHRHMERNIKSVQAPRELLEGLDQHYLENEATAAEDDADSDLFDLAL